MNFQKCVLTKNPKIESRLEKLKDAILLQMKRIDTDSNDELVEIVKLYYNEDSLWHPRNIHKFEKLGSNTL